MQDTNIIIMNIGLAIIDLLWPMHDNRSYNIVAEDFFEDNHSVAFAV